MSSLWEEHVAGVLQGTKMHLLHPDTPGRRRDRADTGERDGRGTGLAQVDLIHEWIDDIESRYLLRPAYHDLRAAIPQVETVEEWVDRMLAEGPVAGGYILHPLPSYRLPKSSVIEPDPLSDLLNGRSMFTEPPNYFSMHKADFRPLPIRWDLLGPVLIPPPFPVSILRHSTLTDVQREEQDSIPGEEYDGEWVDED